MTVVYAQVAPGRWARMQGWWPRGRWVCPLCPRWRFHSLAEHRALVRVIRHPLEPEVWGDLDTDVLVASKGHHPPERFLAAIQADDQVAWALDLLDSPELGALEVRHVFCRFARRKVDGEWEPYWVQVDPGPGACPFTLVALT